tara:strand:+ start:767 stop:1111 length:345 start_codon:yes stop_codon:yes gene_type:complete
MAEHTYSDYWNAVKGFAFDAIEEALDRDDDKDFYEFIDEWLHNLVDGSYWVIYTHAATKVMQYTDHANAYWDVLGEDVSASSWSELVSKLAYFAHEQDIRDRINVELEKEEMVP